MITPDLNGVLIKSEYDALGRTVRETVAPGGEHESSRSFSYWLTSQQGQQASQEMTDINGVRTRTSFDGLNRVIRLEREDVDADGAYRTTYQAAYDAMANLVEATRYDWLDVRDLAVTHHYGYDDWNEQVRVTGSDGISTLTEKSPFGQFGETRRSWAQSVADPSLRGGIVVAEFNVFDKPVTVARQDDQGQVVNSTHFLYDGIGNCVQQTEQLHGENLVTTFEYDALGRMVSTRLPDDTLVARSYADSCETEMPTRLEVTPRGHTDAAILLGTQTYDGLDRLIERRVGARVEQYEYKDDHLQVSQRITAANKVFAYTYDLELTELPRTIEVIGDPDRKTEYTFDPTTAQILGCGYSADAPQREYLYDSFGHLTRESRMEAGDKLRERTYKSSLQGRPLSSDATDGLATQYEYDTSGRLLNLTQGRLTAAFDYDGLGRLERSVTHHLDSGQKLATELEYDSLGRELSRALTLNGRPVRTYLQTWHDDDQLATREQFVDGLSICRETFIYDARRRLEKYSCAGSQLPADIYGNRLVDQVFQFDALDNILRCVSQYEDGSRDAARFTYAPDDPCQLAQVTHTHSSYPASTSFSYDDDGCLLNDELGHALSYELHGGLSQVTNAAGDELVLSCRYDAHHELVGVRNGDESETQRFYDGYLLSHTVQDQAVVQYVYGGEIPLAQQEPADDSKALHLLTDPGGSVVGECLQDGQVRHWAYGPYGEEPVDRLSGSLAFNAEVRESTGWYLLGRGYRAYNPGLMRFHSPDSLSPFGAGGFNPYAYCGGNPIGFRDPTGHRGAGRSRPGGDLPDYVDPIEQPDQGGGWMKWLGVAGAVLILGLSVSALLPLAPMSTAFVVGLAGAFAQGGGIVLQVVGIVTDDEKLYSAGIIAGTVGGVLSTASGILASFTAAQAYRSTAALDGILPGGATPGTGGTYTPRLSTVSGGSSQIGSGASRANSIIPGAPARSGTQLSAVGKMTQSQRSVDAVSFRSISEVTIPAASSSPALGAHTILDTPPPLPPPSTHSLYRPSSPAPQPSTSTVRQPSIRVQRLSIDRGEGAVNAGRLFTNSHGTSFPVAPHRYVPTNRHFGLMNIYKP